MMHAEYDPLAMQYAESKRLVFRVYSEVPNHVQLLGDLSGQRVVDLACGDGFYTRQIRNLGADRVLGVDVSEQMIRLANEHESADPLGIEYVACSATDLSCLGAETFDVASTAFLFNCATDQNELHRMFSEISARLDPGGRLCATVGDLGHRPGIDYSPYGMRTQIPSDLEEGAPYSITFLLESSDFTITDYNHSLSTYEKIGESAGLRFQGWYPCTVTDEGFDAFGQDFWQRWIDSPCIWRFVATKV